MIHDVISRMSISIWPLIGLIICMLAFVGVIIWTYRGRKDRFHHEASLPLDDNIPNEKSNGANHG